MSCFLFLSFISVPAGGCGIQASCMLGKCAARLTQDAVLLFPVLVLSYEQSSVNCLDCIKNPKFCVF